MADKLNRLSIVAQFDDIVRNRTILTAGIETGIAFKSYFSIYDHVIKDTSLIFLLLSF